MVKREAAVDLVMGRIASAARSSPSSLTDALIIDSFRGLWGIRLEIDFLDLVIVVFVERLIDLVAQRVVVSTLVMDVTAVIVVVVVAATCMFDATLVIR